MDTFEQRIKKWMVRNAGKRSIGHALLAVGLGMLTSVTFGSMPALISVLNYGLVVWNAIAAIVAFAVWYERRKCRSRS